MSKNQTPSIGRIVHYTLQSGKHRPAIIVEVFPDEFGPGIYGVNLQQFTDGENDQNIYYEKNDYRVEIGKVPDWNPYGVIWRTSVKFSEEKEPGTCHWPEYVE